MNQDPPLPPIPTTKVFLPEVSDDEWKVYFVPDHRTYEIHLKARGQESRSRLIIKAESGPEIHFTRESTMDRRHEDLIRRLHAIKHKEVYDHYKSKGSN